MEGELLADEKELAEHNMLVDLGRNDLGKISKFGTVKVRTPAFDRALLARNAHWLDRARRDQRRSRRIGRNRGGTPGGHAVGRAEDHARASLSASWRTTSAAYTAAPSATSTLPATWIPASRYASHIRKTARCSCAAARALWRTPFPKRNLRNA